MYAAQTCFLHEFKKDIHADVHAGAHRHAKKLERCDCRPAQRDSLMTWQERDHEKKLEHATHEVRQLCKADHDAMAAGVWGVCVHGGGTCSHVLV